MDAKHKPEANNSKLTLVPPQMTILSDHHFRSEGDDLLNLESKLSVVLDILRHRETRCPVTVAIYGDWGSGKTSAMHWLETQLGEWNRLKREARGNHPRVYPIWFDPWKYHSREAVWRGIIAEVILSLFRVSQLDGHNFRIRITEAAKKFGAFLGKSFLHALVNTELRIKPESMGTIAGPEVKFSGEMFRDIYDEFEKTNHPEKAHLNQFEETLRQWVTGCLNSEDERVVLFIDDLDRCLPEVTLEVLEAIKLYLNIPQLMFVVGVDRSVVDSVVIKHYETHGLGKSKARQYLDKIFQVEIQISPSEQQMRGFLDRQIVALDHSTGGYWRLSLEEKYRHPLEQGIRELAQFNPRETKRLLNCSLLLGRAAADNGSLAPSSGDTAEARRLRFAQGVQSFLIQRFLETRLQSVHRIWIEQKNLLWFERISAFALKYPDFVKQRGYQSRENGLIRLRLRGESSSISRSNSVDEWEELLEQRPIDELTKILGEDILLNGLLWSLLQIPFSAPVAQFAPQVAVVSNSSSEKPEPPQEKRNSAKDLVMKAITQIEEFHERQGGTTGISTGFASIDKVTSGMHPAETIVLASKDQNDASALAMNILEHVAVNLKLPVAYFTFNTDSEALMLKMMLSRARVNLQNVRDGYLAERDLPKITGAAGKLATCSIFIQDDLCSLREIRKFARDLTKKHPLGLLVIDSFQALTNKDNSISVESTRKEIVELTAGIKALARDIRVPVIIVSSLKVDNEDLYFVPKASDLNELGPVEQHVDSIILLHSHDRSQDWDDRVNTYRLLFIKHSNGTGREVGLQFLRDVFRFTEESVSEEDALPTERPI